MRRFVLISLILASSPQLAGADCARVGLTPKVLTPANTTLTGGIVVGSVGVIGGKLEPGDVAIQKQWRAGKAAPQIRVIAPGLAVYGVTGEGELTDGTKTLFRYEHASTKSVPLPAPLVSRATHSGEFGGYHTPERVELELERPLPATTVAVVLLDAKTGAAKSWWAVAGSSKTYGFYQETCTPQPNGTRLSARGESIKVIYVDASGTVSLPSPAIRID